MVRLILILVLLAPTSAQAFDAKWIHQWIVKKANFQEYGPGCHARTKELSLPRETDLYINIHRPQYETREQRFNREQNGMLTPLVIGIRSKYTLLRNRKTIKLQFKLTETDKTTSPLRSKQKDEIRGKIKFTHYRSGNEFFLISDKASANERFAVNALFMKRVTFYQLDGTPLWTFNLSKFRLVEKICQIILNRETYRESDFSGLSGNRTGYDFWGDMFILSGNAMNPLNDKALLKIPQTEEIRNEQQQSNQNSKGE